MGRGLSRQQLAILQRLKHGPADLRPRLTGDHSERKSCSASLSRTLRRLRERRLIERYDPFGANGLLHLGNAMRTRLRTYS
jgi:hypothetical protein